ncbi:Retrotransposon-like protein 1 [Anabarilius grahami]|uniref:Retrotransposon-like protein 1 n=1 Tax=Anabarilius grahami TaxID=495550 RepID=A0A3N0Z4S9_ANAGA|nr:Retrotransposon-like protein 1 [Anabarilius grahami]
MARPAPFSGLAEDCNGFILQRSLVLEMQPHLYPDDKAKVAFIIQQLTGKALRWAEPLWTQNSPVMQSLSTFISHFKELEGSRGLRDRKSDLKPKGHVFESQVRQGLSSDSEPSLLQPHVTEEQTTTVRTSTRRWGIFLVPIPPTVHRHRVSAVDRLWTLRQDGRPLERYVEEFSELARCST